MDRNGSVRFHRARWRRAIQPPRCLRRGAHIELVRQDSAARRLVYIRREHWARSSHNPYRFLRCANRLEAHAATDLTVDSLSPSTLAAIGSSFSAAALKGAGSIVSLCAIG